MKISISVDTTPESLAVFLFLGVVQISHLAAAGKTGDELDRISRNAMELAATEDQAKIWRQFSGYIGGGTIQIESDKPNSASPPHASAAPTPHAGNPSCYISMPRVAPIDWGKLGERETFETFYSLEAGVRWAHWEFLDARHRARIASAMKSFSGRFYQFKSSAGVFVTSLATPDEFVQYAGMAEAYVPGDIRDKLRVEAGAIGKPLDLDAAERYAALIAEFFLQMGMPVDPFKVNKPAKAPRAQKVRK